MDKKYLYIAGAAILLLYLYYTYSSKQKTVAPVTSKKTDYTYDVEPTVSLRDIQSKFSKVYDLEKSYTPIQGEGEEEDISEGEEDDISEGEEEDVGEEEDISEGEEIDVEFEIPPEQINEEYVKTLEELRDSIYYNMVKIENDFITKFQNSLSKKNLNETLAQFNAQKALYNADPSVENEVAMKLAQTKHNKEKTAIRNQVEQAKIDFRNTNEDWKGLAKMYDATEDKISKIYSELGIQYRSTVGIYNPFYYN
jgi:hypothetical protein